jgi:hypothetical protein
LAYFFLHCAGLSLGSKVAFNIRGHVAVSPLPTVVGEPMSEKLARLPSVGFWIVITLSVSVLVVCLLGSIIGLMAE